MRATASAQANIALVKYWGKRDASLNLPAAGSVSATLDGLGTTTTVVFGGAERDQLFIDRKEISGAGLAKATKVLDLVREKAGIAMPALVDSHNTFPTGAGLASSASGLAALTIAAAKAADLDLSDAQLSAIARQGSGSASRSIYGGFARWHRGEAADGSDSYAEQVFAADHWDLRVMVVVISSQEKEIPSRAGMVETARTSPYHEAFVDAVEGDIEACIEAIGHRDFAALGRVAERSCLRMHADMMAADPAIIYLKPESWHVIAQIRALQKSGIPVFFTADAGPNIKVFCLPEAFSELQERLGQLPGVERLIRARIGAGPEVAAE